MFYQSGDQNDSNNWINSQRDNALNFSIPKWFIILVCVLGVIFLASFGRNIFTDWIWFQNIGFEDTYSKIIVSKVLLFLIGFITFIFFAFPTVIIANKIAKKESQSFSTNDQLFSVINRLIFWGSLLITSIFGVIFGSILSSNWLQFLKVIDSSDFNKLDPIYALDLAFYIFQLPIFSLIQSWLFGSAIVILIISFGIFYLSYVLHAQTFRTSESLRIQISIIVGILFLLIAIGHYIGRWELLLSTDGAIFGASYTDIHAKKPALFILTIVASACAILSFANTFLKQDSLRLIFACIALWAVFLVILTIIWPRVMQQFTVTPNEFNKEAPYIGFNIDHTRIGFALNRIDDEFFPAESTVTSDIIQNNFDTINNIRLWDYRPLTDVYKQIQLIRTYYDFKDADIDRYTLNNSYRQVMLAAREVAPEKLSEETQTWLNTKLIYTHGIGAAISPATEFTKEGRPEFFARDIPPNGKINVGLDPENGEIEFSVENPRIYYGENTSNYVVVNSKTAELDYQTKSDDIVRINYFGTGGVKLNSFLRKAVYAWQFGDINILISGEITSSSRLQYRRLIQERIGTVAPFLQLDKDPYIVATSDRFYWVQDAYTTTDRMPYSQPFQGQINYMRNSVKIVVDAFDGTLFFYIADDTDPIIQTFDKIFPNMFLPLEKMPAELKPHVRYPQDFFYIQSSQYLKYHMDDPQNFYNNEDLWSIPNEKFAQQGIQPVEPYYAIMRLPNEPQEEFVLLLPFTPNQRQNAIGWLAARSDGENYGKLVAYNFPKDRQIDGPEQVEARIDNDQTISEWFTLRCQEGSTCIRGNLLVIPIGDSILYAEPVYIQAEGVKFPELKRVILASGEKVVMENSLSEAIESLTGLTTSTNQNTNINKTEESNLNPVNITLEEIKSFTNQIKTQISDLEKAIEKLKKLTGE